MKKIVLLFSFFLLLSCSNSDDDVSSSSADFNPPEWLQGNWVLQDAITSNAVVFNFSKSDFCMTASYVKQCQKELVDQMRNNGGKVKVTETVTPNSYTAEITYYAGQSIIYSFRKLSNNTMEWTQSPGAVFVKQ